MYSKHYAKSFIKEYHLTELNYDILKTIIEKLGFTLFTFNKYYNDESTIEFIQSLNVEEDIKTKKSFTHDSEGLRTVFLRDNLSENDQITLLLHEIGHIYMDHTIIKTLNQDVKLENAANQFAYSVIKLIKNKSRFEQVGKITIITMIIVVLMSLLVSNLLSIYQKQIAINTTTNNQNLTLPDSSSSIITTTPTTPKNTTASKPSTAKPTTTTKKSIKTTPPYTQLLEYDFPTDINIVSYEQLLEIPGIGTETAQKIVDFRIRQGTIQDMDTLTQINGIGEVKLNLLKQYLFVSDNNMIQEQSSVNSTSPTTTTKCTVAPPVTKQTTTSKTSTLIKHMKNVNINTASANEISDCLLLDIDLAEKIIDLRNQIQYFSNSLELLYIDGFTQSMYNERKDYVIL